MMKRKKAVLSIDCLGHETIVTGPKLLMSKMFDLPYYNYYEDNGSIVLKMYDYIPYEGRIRANAKIAYLGNRYRQ